jgi:hypothetical protein
VHFGLTLSEHWCLLTLLSALVVGLVIWTAYAVYSGQNIAIQTLAAKFRQFDLALKDYGPEASAGRTQLGQDIAKTIEQIWNREQAASEFTARNFASAIDNLHHREEYLRSLNPSTDAQKQALAAAAQTLIRLVRRVYRCHSRSKALFRIRSCLW